MQRVIRAQSEYIYHTFVDSDHNAIKDMTGVTVTVRDVNGDVVVDNNSVTLEDVSAVAAPGRDGTFRYAIVLSSTAAVQGVNSLYGAWWSGTSTRLGVTLRQDTPEVFQSISAAAGIVEQAVVQNARTRLLMYINKEGVELVGTRRFENKYKTDTELVDHVYDAQDDFNVAPPKITALSLSELIDLGYSSLLTDGVVVHALVGLEILEAGKHFVYSDMGISLTRDRHSKYAQTAQRYLQMYWEKLVAVKKVYAMRSVVPVGLFSGVAGMPRSLDRALRGTHKMNWMNR